MANGIEEFSESRNLARVASGWKGGPFLAKPNLAPPMKIVPGWPSETLAKLDAGMVPQPTPLDGWSMRRAFSPK